VDGREGECRERDADVHVFAGAGARRYGRPTRDGDGPAMAAAADTALMRFSVWYQHIHGYLSLVACVFAPVKVIGQGHGS